VAPARRTRPIVSVTKPGRAARGVGGATPQAVVQHLVAAGPHGQQRVIAALSAARDACCARLGQSIRFAQGRVEVDRQRRSTRTSAGGPGAAQQLAADDAELTGMAPTEGAQEGSDRRGRRHPLAEHGGGGAGAQGIHVVDAVATGQGAHDQGQALVGHVGATRRRTEIDVALEQLGQTQPPGQGGRQQQAGVGDQARVVEGRALDGKGVGSGHRTGVLRLTDWLWSSTPVSQLRWAPVRPSRQALSRSGSVDSG